MPFWCATFNAGVLKLAARGAAPARAPLGDPVAGLALEPPGDDETPD
jgi:hypothetical protein